MRFTHAPPLTLSTLSLSHLPTTGFRLLKGRDFAIYLLWYPQHLAQGPVHGGTKSAFMVLNYKSFVWNSAHISPKKCITNASGRGMLPASPEKFI